MCSVCVNCMFSVVCVLSVFSVCSASWDFSVWSGSCFLCVFRVGSG